MGDIGPGGAMPVMEGKAVLFKELAGVDAYPICLDTKDPDEIVNIVKAISPGFGGINLEDISAPRCFYVEERLKDELDIPIFHDDQHGTAVVVLAGLINALKISGKQMQDLKVAVNGVGAGGIACAKMLMTAGCFNIIGCDTQGIVYRGRDNRGNKAKDEFAEISNPDNIEGDLTKALQGADVFLGLSGPNTVTPAMVKDMNDEPIVFAMANPDPEIWPEEAQGIARVMATGRSDYPNQINNALCFPRHLPGRPRRSGPRDQRGDEARRGPRHRRRRPQQRPERGLHHPQHLRQERRPARRPRGCRCRTANRRRPSLPPPRHRLLPPPPRRVGPARLEAAYSRASSRATRPGQSRIR